MVKIFTAALAIIVIAGSDGCTRLSPIEAKLVGTWGFPSISGEIDHTYRADHTWIAEGSGDPLKGRWWIEGNELVSYLEPPKAYANMPMFAFLRERRRQTILKVTMKRLVTVSDGVKTEILRMCCPRCGAGLGSFHSRRTLPTRQMSCPKCGFRLEDV
jgi:predicted RNA-binding Zn-ribbon protein involved in translation (DUF1610 family)